MASSATASFFGAFSTIVVTTSLISVSSSQAFSSSARLATSFTVSPASSAFSSTLLAHCLSSLLVGLDVHHGRWHRIAAGNRLRHARGKLAVGALIDDEEDGWIFGTKPFASMSSRSSRCFSSLRIGSRASAQCNVGGIATVVITAMVTIMVNRFGLRAPHGWAVGRNDHLGGAARIGAGRRQPANARRRVRPASFTPINAPPDIAEAGDDDQSEGERQQVPFLEDGEVNN